MLKLIDSIQKALLDSNYVAAVFMAVTIPDICGQVEYEQDKRHYKKWFEANMPLVYKEHIGGSDAYAIRCALLHTFGNNLSRQRAHELLEKYLFTSNGAHLGSITNVTINNLRYPNTVIINPRVYSEDIIHAYQKWINQLAAKGLQNKYETVLKETLEFTDHINIGGAIQFT